MYIENATVEACEYEPTVQSVLHKYACYNFVTPFTNYMNLHIENLMFMVLTTFVDVLYNNWILG